jgi:hypothetical protein
MPFSDHQASKQHPFPQTQGQYESKHEICQTGRTLNGQLGRDLERCRFLRAGVQPVRHDDARHDERAAHELHR